MNEMKWSDEQSAIFGWFRSGTGSLVVQARAGTGKTTTIKEAFSHAPEEKMLYCVFNKKNQVEAQAKIQDPRVEIKTLHSLGYAYIRQNWRGVKPDGFVERDRIEACRPGTPKEVVTQIAKLVGFAKNLFVAPTLQDLIDTADARGISAGDKFEDAGFTVEKLAEIALQAIERSKKQDSRGRISFDDMVFLPVAMGWVRPWFNLVVVDEAQDMNLPQLLMARGACKKDGRICVVGDDRQAIYGFRGACSDGMRMMQDSLRAASLGLTTTYRCPKAVVKIAAEIVSDYKAAPAAPDGIVESMCLDAAMSSAQVGDAILSRLNAPLMPLCLSLLRRGIPARIEGRDIGKQLTDIVKKLHANSVPDFLRKIRVWGDKRIARLTAAKKESVITVIEDQVETLIATAEGCKNVTEIEERLTRLFQDSDSNQKPAVVLSSVHKAKGLEWTRVFVIESSFRRNGGEEEQNIFYVAVTRAKQSLVFVTAE